MTDGRTRHNGGVTDAPAKGLILVVEDERPIADLVRLYLSREGFGVHVEHDGPGGLAAARRLRPVAAVLDIALPGFEGTEICRRLRAAGDWTPIIFLTARDDEIDRLLGLETGADDFIAKPFSARELKARVNAMFRRPRTVNGVLPVATHATATDPEDKIGRAHV